jgi:DNA repair ATPase RecN
MILSDFSEHSLERQNTHLKSELVTLRQQSQSKVQTSLDTTQQELSKKQATEAQVSLLVHDLDRMTQRVQSLTRENSELKDNLNNLNNDDESIKVLQTELELVRYKMESQAKELSGTIATYSNDLASNRQEISELVLKNSEMADYDILKKELNVLKSLEFDEVDGPLDQQLLRKLRTVEGNLNSVNNAHAATITQLESLTGELNDSYKSLESQKKLVQRMEIDISKLQKQPTNNPSQQSFETLLGSKVISVLIFRKRLMMVKMALLIYLQVNVIVINNDLSNWNS